MTIANLNLPATFTSYRFSIVFGVPTRNGGSPLVEIPYDGYNVLSSNIHLTAYEYSTDGQTYLTATPTDSSVTTGLTFSSDGIGNVFKWQAYADLGANLFNKTIYFRIRATDTVYLSSLDSVSFTVKKTSSTPGAGNNSPFSNNYRGISGSSLAQILKPISG